MRYTVYGLRLAGSREVRYLGQTNGPVELRLLGHLGAAERRVHNPELCDWLTAHRGSVEIFKIAYCDTRAEALGTERALIALARGLGQRLLNQRTGPRAKKLAA